MEFRLLGPLEVRDGDRLVPLGGPKQRTLLASLILQANEVVTIERLIDAVWVDEPPGTARNTLQTYIKHLRRLLGADRILHRASGYAFVADRDEVDVLQFEDLIEEARSRTQRDPSGAAATLRRAIALWRGSALDDLAEQASLRFEIARLEELRIAAREELIEADLALGRHRELVPELETLTGRHPFRERLWGQLMVALYRSGRQGDALAAYNRARLVLTDQLGIDPSPELRRLQEQVLKQDPALELTGEPLRGYRLLEPIGRGAFGAVHRAFQPDLGREVAVKVISPRLANDPEYIRRFDAEAQLVSRLEHPHIVPLYDYWREPGGAYLVMRYLRGGSLQKALSDGAFDTDRAVRLVDQVAEALHSAHRQGVVHRDVKPANILFDEDGNAYLSDFGIAKDLAAAETSTRRTRSSPLAFYVSPEEARGETPTHLADIYNLGLVVYESLTGRHAFAETPPDELVDRQVREPVPSVRSSRPDLPAAVDGVIERATAKEPEERFPDAPSLAVAFREACTQAARVPARAEAVAPRNPYKGLRPFLEADSRDFFGRETSTQQILRRLEDDVDGSRFLAVVGPSGSGKSSLVRAGLVPALRLGGLPGSDGWFFVDLVPGAGPFEELDAAIVRIAVDPRPDLIERLEGDEGGLVRIAEEILPDDDSELFLVIDQFEEVFTLVHDEDTRLRFLAAIVAATTDPRSRIRVVVTLRADFYDRPLQYKAFGELLARRTYAVTPLSVAELERAVAGPAEIVGIAVDPRLVGEVVAEVADRPGALPLLQYALTELFEERRDSTLTFETYHELGGVWGALARRAEDLYGRLNDAGKEAARQLFLRLVGLGEGGSEDTRKRVLRSELTSLEVDRESMEAAIYAFGNRRLLSFDRDPETRGPTVEVAHETLLREWGRLRGWIESAREDLRMHTRLSAAAREWLDADRGPDYLLTGSRLEQVDQGTRTSSIRLTEQERQYLDAGLAQREAELAAERERRSREARLERRALVRMRALVAVLAVASLVAASLTVVAVSRSGEAERVRNEALLSAQRERAGRLSAASVASLNTDPELSLRLALHSVDVIATLGETVPAATVEAMHWALQEAGVQYPVSDAPAAVVDGPLGPRGVDDLSLPELLELARPYARSLSRDECQQYFGEGDCPPLPITIPPNLRAEPIRAEEPRTASQPLTGTKVTVWLVFDPTWQNDFQDDLGRFTTRTGIDVELVGSEHFEDQIEQSIAAGDPPDLALFPQPGGVATYAREGLLMDLGAYLDVAQLRRDQSPYLISLGTVASGGSWPSDKGGTYGAFVDLSIKSLIWYPVAELRAAGYAIPGTWAELITLGDRLVADGRTPWCLGLGSPGAAGWPGTDWIENLVLAGAGPQAYDRWTFHEIGFDDHAIREAFRRLGQVVFAPDYLHRGTDGAIETLFEDAQRPMAEVDPPGCWFHLAPTFGAKLLPPGSVGSTIEAFPFPAISERFRGAVLGGGTMVAAFADRPEVREVVRFLLGPEHGAEWAGLGHGFLSSNRRFDPKNYPPFWRRQSRVLSDALASDTFRFDGSDLMPPEVGLHPFWNAMIEYLDKGPDSLDRILADLDAAWPDDG